jgi:hypothetical protein
MSMIIYSNIYLFRTKPVLNLDLTLLEQFFGSMNIDSVNLHKFNRNCLQGNGKIIQGFSKVVCWKAYSFVHMFLFMLCIL